MGFCSTFFLFHKKTTEHHSMYTLTKEASVPLESFRACLASKKFNDWIAKVDTNERLNISKIKILNIFMCGSNVGFVNLVVDATNKQTGKPVPGYCFIRGDATSFLTLIKDKTDGLLYMVLTEQDRLPIASCCFESPAGIMDEKKNIKSVALKELKELKEETGLDYKNAIEPLTFLGEFYPSAGGCDEKIHCAYILFEKEKAEIEELQGKMTGEIDTCESIKLHIVPFSVENALKTQDAKTIACTMFFLRHVGQINTNQFVMSGFAS